MVTTLPTVVPPLVAPPASTIIVSLGMPFVIALLVAAFAVVGAVLLQGAVSAPPRRRPELPLLVPTPQVPSSRHAA